MSFRLTYATMFNPPEAMHERFDAALAAVGGTLGGTHALYIDGQDDRRCRRGVALQPDRPATFGSASSHSRTLTHVEAAMRAAQAAFPAWRATPVAERARLLRRVADVMEARVYDIAAALALEVGKNRMEALGEAQETVDFFRHYADDFERHAGYEHELPNDPLPGVVSRNRSVMRPYGVWAIIAPFNFPLALAGGPTAAALVTGNTVVVKGATRHALGRSPAGRLHPRRGPAAGRVQLSLGFGPRGRRGARRASAARRPDVHRFGAGRHGTVAADDRRRVSAPVHRGDGRQESVHRHRARRISTTLPPASCARRTAWAARSARRCRASTSMLLSPTR